MLGRAGRNARCRSALARCRHRHAAYIAHVRSRPVVRDLALRLRLVKEAKDDAPLQLDLEDVLLIRLGPRLWPQVRDDVGAADRKRDEVVDLVERAVGGRNVVGGERLPLRRCGDVPALSRGPVASDVTRGRRINGARRHDRVGERRRISRCAGADARGKDEREA